MMRAALLSLLALGACSPAARDTLTRDAARSVVGRVVVARFPDLPVGPSVDCVVDNATVAEINSLASETVTGPTAAATQTVGAVAARPATLRCLAREGLSDLARRTAPGAAYR